jgi:hypothetical protein
MQLELRPEMVDRLIHMPESGMGYQVVDLVLIDGRVVPNVTVFNSEIADLPDEFRDVRPSDVTDVQLRSRGSRR